MYKTLIFCFICFYAFNVSAQKIKQNISGKVSSDGKPLENVNIRVKNAATGVLTNARGKYSIQVFEGQVLVFSHVGMQTIEVELDENNVVNLEMSQDVKELDEVVVKKKKVKAFSQRELLADYPTNKNLIKTNWGIIDKERSSYSIYIIDADEIIPVGLNFLTSLANHFPNWANRRGSTRNPIFDIDGFIYREPPFIHTSEIDRIAIIQGPGAYIRYGTAGAGGVVIVNTKEKTRADDLGVERFYNNSDLVDSLVNEVVDKKKFTNPRHDFLNELEKVKSEKRAIEIFQKRKEDFRDNPSYFLAVSKYFRNKWESDERSREILTSLENGFSTNTKVLKALAYHYEEFGQKEKALEIYLRILNLESRAAQSHRDVANAYAEIGNYKKALGNFARYELAVDALDTIPFDGYGNDLLLTTEIHNILSRFGKELSLDEERIQDPNLPNQNVRLLFEWNHPAAEFELQVVSPDDYYDEWNTPKTASKSSKNYLSKQFFLDDDFKGEWKVNLNYTGNRTEQPTFLKVTAFFDYGKPSQSKQSKVFEINENGIDVKLFSVFTEKKYIRP